MVISIMQGCQAEDCILQRMYLFKFYSQIFADDLFALHIWFECRGAYVAIRGALGSLSAFASEMIDSETWLSMRTRHNALNSVSFPGARPFLLRAG